MIIKYNKNYIIFINMDLGNNNQGNINYKTNDEKHKIQFENLISPNYENIFRKDKNDEIFKNMCGSVEEEKEDLKVVENSQKFGKELDKNNYNTTFYNLDKRILKLKKNKQFFGLLEAKLKFNELKKLKSNDESNKEDKNKINYLKEIDEKGKKQKKLNKNIILEEKHDQIESSEDEKITKKYDEFKPFDEKLSKNKDLIEKKNQINLSKIDNAIKEKDRIEKKNNLNIKEISIENIILKSSNYSEMANEQLERYKNNQSMHIVNPRYFQNILNIKKPNESNHLLNSVDKVYRSIDNKKKAKHILINEKIDKAEIHQMPSYFNFKSQEKNKNSFRTFRNSAGNSMGLRDNYIIHSNRDIQKNDEKIALKGNINPNFGILNSSENDEKKEIVISGHVNENGIERDEENDSKSELSKDGNKNNNKLNTGKKYKLLITEEEGNKNRKKEFENMKKELSEDNDDIDNLKEEDIKSNEVLKLNKEETEKLKKEDKVLNEKKDKINKKLKDNNDLLLKIEELNKDKEKLKEIKKENLRKYKSKLSNFKEKNLKLKEIISNLEKKNKELEKDKQEINNELYKEKEKVEKLNKEKEEINKELQKEKEMNEKINEEKGEINNKLLKEKEKNDKINKEKEGINNELENEIKKNKEINNLKLENQELNEIIKEEKQKYNILNNKNIDLNKENDYIKSELKKGIDEKNNLIKENEKLYEENLKNKNLVLQYDKEKIDLISKKEDLEKQLNDLIFSFKQNQIQQNELLTDIMNNNPLILYTKPTLIGLNNIGATCFMNSTLQCLSQTQELASYFLKPKYRNEIIKNISLENMNNSRLCPVFLELIQKLWDRNASKSFSPNKFMNTVNEINPLFKTGQAGDAKDFIIFVLEQLHKELKKSINPNNNLNLEALNQYDKNNSLNHFFKDFKNELSIISDIFYGFNETTNECLNCKNIYNFKGLSNNPICYNYGIFNCLIFPLEEVKNFKFNNNFQFNNYFQINNCVSINDCFQYNQKTEIFTGQNRNYCNQCKQLFDSYYTSKIYICPTVLIIILNRGKGNIYNIKLFFDEIIDITEFVLQKESSKIVYNLYGVITHIGQSGPNAHFVASCKSPIDNKWYRYNDSFVNPIENVQKEIIDFGTPYILFYHK